MDFDGDKVFSSQNLHAELNEERKKNGLPEIPLLIQKHPEVQIHFADSIRVGITW